jgi:hypothetical protein
VRRSLCLLAAVAGAACSSNPPGAKAGAPAADEVLSFTFDAPAGSERYECFGFDASALAGRWLTGIEWKAPLPGSGPDLHHAALYVSPQDYPDGPVTCDAMPVAWTMHLWLPGAPPLTLPSGVALVMPAGTKRLVIQAHVLRASVGPAGRASAVIHSTGEAPTHEAKWLPADGSVPALRPNMTQSTATTCIAAAPMHIVSSSPHMHLLGVAFQGAFVKSDAARSVFLDVPSWNFDQQKTYEVDRDVTAGEGVESDCTWDNTTDAYVLPGRSTHDEMCGQALIVWPAATARWSGCQ